MAPLVLPFLSLALQAAPPLEPPARELGSVRWLRSLAEAQEKARALGQPMLVLFDEVPGCQTCVHYGESVLSDPLIVELAETLFVPLAVYNNRPGEDRRALERFGEPTWNNPVVRIVDDRLEPLAPRLVADYSVGGLLDAMQVALTRAARPVPEYLAALVAEHAPGRTELRYYAMGCFWSGEVCLGALPGVRATRVGHAGGREVVEVRYDAARTSGAALDAAARGCGEPVDGAGFRYAASDDKYHLGRSAWRAADLTPMQRTRVNARLGRGLDPRPLLSPRQRASVEP